MCQKSASRIGCDHPSHLSANDIGRNGEVHSYDIQTANGRLSVQRAGTVVLTLTLLTTTGTRCYGYGLSDNEIGESEIAVSQVAETAGWADIDQDGAQSD